MTKTKERCKHCGASMMPLMHNRTGAISEVVACGHCDTRCDRPRCPTCAKMLKTVRLKPGE